MAQTTITHNQALDSPSKDREETGPQSEITITIETRHRTVPENN
jgi:hypothetical protein